MYSIKETQQVDSKSFIRIYLVSNTSAMYSIPKWSSSQMFHCELAQPHTVTSICWIQYTKKTGVRYCHPAVHTVCCL